MADNVRAIGRDTSGSIDVQLTEAGFRCTKNLCERVATPNYQSRAHSLQEAFGKWSTGAIAIADDPSRLVFAYDDAWEPLMIWLQRHRDDSCFPLATALRFASTLCEALQVSVTAIDAEPELHGGAIIVSEFQAPFCRLLLWPHDASAAPADYLDCTPEVLLCTPPEDFCGVPLADRRVYVAAAMLKLIFSDGAEERDSGELIEAMVMEGNAGGLTLPQGVPPGLQNAVRSEWDTLSDLVQRATSRRARARDVALEQLADASQALFSRLNYWDLVTELCAKGQYEDARDVCEYAIQANLHDNFLRRAFKRQLGKINLDHLYKYEKAAAVFRDYIASEQEPDVRTVTMIRQLYGDALAARSLHDEALHVYEQAAREAPEDLDLLLKIAGIHRDHGNPEAALQTLHKLIAADRNHIEAMKMSAEIDLELGNPQVAQIAASRALHAIRSKLARGVLDASAAAPQIADMQALAATSLFDQSNYDNALQLAGESLRADPQCYRALNVFGRDYLRKAKIVPAVRSFLASLRINSNQPEIERWLKQGMAGDAFEGGEDHSREGDD